MNHPTNSKSAREDDELLTPAELKARLKISTRTYSRLLASRRIPFRLIGTMKRFCWTEVLAALPKGPEAATRPATRGPIDLTAMLKKQAANWKSR